MAKTLARARDLLPDGPDQMLDARMLLAHAAGLTRDKLHRLELSDFTPEFDARFAALLARRAGGEPVSKILGHRDFWNYRFHVTPDVLDPRPETECLIALALQAPFSRVLDLGTGSGAILLTLLAERPQARGTGADLSAAALQVAARNAEALGVSDRATLITSDWFSDVEGEFDLIVSNPPYIAADEMAGLSRDVLGYDPRMALTDEGDGLSVYRLLAAQSGARLQRGGRIIVEIGPTQGEAVRGFFAAAGFSGVRVHPDLDGRDRNVSAIKG
ncbi:peptide chain release factor N(5)-glutamine methyltransferase [Falsigemmobacter faecalis]|uniref:Release factor glutamine methyltransferase n=2 Tax=Falsigemmobacter faecalis TaxID=2488730 RepID=A0A3P3DLN6_9RHOB|nr:peptide chain release factor N(5)-glutamine methyltransferase [Falsigemmobacter faecalis]